MTGDLIAVAALNKHITPELARRIQYVRQIDPELSHRDLATRFGVSLATIIRALTAGALVPLNVKLCAGHLKLSEQEVQAHYDEGERWCSIGQHWAAVAQMRQDSSVCFPCDSTKKVK